MSKANALATRVALGIKGGGGIRSSNTQLEPLGNIDAAGKLWWTREIYTELVRLQIV